MNSTRDIHGRGTFAGPQPLTKNHRQLRKLRGRNGFPGEASSWLSNTNRRGWKEEGKERNGVILSKNMLKNDVRNPRRNVSECVCFVRERENTLSFINTRESVGTCQLPLIRDARGQKCLGFWRFYDYL